VAAASASGLAVGCGLGPPLFAVMAWSRAGPGVVWITGFAADRLVRVGVVRACGGRRRLGHGSDAVGGFNELLRRYLGPRSR
jgi:hypothetical protein